MRYSKTHILIAWIMAAFLSWNAAISALADSSAYGSDAGRKALATGTTTETEGMDALGIGVQDPQLQALLQQETETSPKPEIPIETELQPQTEGSSYPQLTAEDIVRLDEGDAEVLFDDAGRANFIRGRYSPEKVENMEDAVESLNYVATLLGLTNGALFFCVYKGVDYTTGYTYYLFLQRDGDVTVVNASIKIYVDPEGYTAALSCSFDPEVGVRESSEGKITAKEAEEIVARTYSGSGLKVYEGSTIQAGVMENEVNEHVWCVYTNNPDAGSGRSDQPFLQHFVSYKGEYLMNLPADTLSAPLLGEDDAFERKAKALFEGYEPDTWKGEVTLHNGNTALLEIPVARSSKDGMYYLMDLERKMVVADFSEAVYGSGEYIISSSADNSGWEDREVIAMYNIARAYDYYADHGVRSVDGFGIPLMILSGVCEADGTPVDNAFFYGYQDGFGMFAISDINNTVESLDIMAHEYTHGITSYTMGGSAYVNDMGAINEAFSDIMGNLCELTYAINDLSIARGKTTGQFDVTGTSPVGSTDEPDPVFPDWRIGEMCGRTYRDMSDPIRFNQPAFVGDAYYCMPASRSDFIGNDYGGVHENSSLLGSIAWVMNEHGLTFENQYSLWMTAMNLMTPKSDYDDILQGLIFARKSYGYDEGIDIWLAEAFAERGMLENSHSFSGTWDGVTFAEYNRDYLSTSAGKWEDIAGKVGQISDPIAAGSGQTSQSMDPREFLDPAQEETKTGKTQDSTDAGDGVRDGGWLAGVGLDGKDHVTREGFGRIELECSLKDRDTVIGAIAVDPYTYTACAITCCDKDGMISFLVPEGNYWIWLCVNEGGQTNYWAYGKSGSYEEQTAFTVYQPVEASYGEITTLPATDIS